MVTRYGLLSGGTVGPGLRRDDEAIFVDHNVDPNFFTRSCAGMTRTRGRFCATVVRHPPGVISG